MKTTKKVLAFLIVAMMIVAMLPNALASETGTTPTTYKITISNAQAGHTYTAYQIFTGDLSMNGATRVLSNIAFGSGVSDDGKTALLTLDDVTYTDVTALAEALTAANVSAFAQKAAAYLATEAKHVDQAAAGDCVIDGLAAGYYLVIDSYTTAEGEKSDALSNYMVQVVGDASVESKHSFPTLDKQINHNEFNSWGVVGDNQIGDTVSFRTITTVPNTTGYTDYVYTITDTMSVGLTSNVQTGNGNGDVVIKVNDEGALDAKYITVTVDEGNKNKFYVTVDILAAVAAGDLSANDKLYTYYSGVLNDEAKIYDEGKQDNIAYLDYSNNPNDTESKGKTPEKRVYDWTFKMGVNKVNTSGEALTGAKFVLSESNAIKVADLGCDENGVPADSATENLIKLVKIDASTYRIATGSDVDTTYVIEAGSVVIKGLDDATDYYLYETKAPEGYNLLDAPVSFKITVSYNEDGSQVAENNPTVTVGNGAPSETLSTNVVNKAGATLPETGGIGTTLFYVIGSILVIGAVVLLVSKKRMNAID